MGTLITNASVIERDGESILKIANVGECILNLRGKNMFSKGKIFEVTIKSMNS